jgi:hypothetical protein
LGFAAPGRAYWSAPTTTPLPAPRALKLTADWGSEALIVRGAGPVNVTAGHRHWQQGSAYRYRLDDRIEQHV